MTFDDAGAGADQEFNLVHDTSCTLEYKVKTVTFSSVHHLSLHFPSNFGEDQTRIYYIGLAGEFTAANRSKYFSPDKCFSLKIFPTGWGWSTACTRPGPWWRTTRWMRRRRCLVAMDRLSNWSLTLGCEDVDCYKYHPYIKGSPYKFPNFVLYSIRSILNDFDNLKHGLHFLLFLRFPKWGVTSQISNYQNHSRYRA